MELVYQIKHIDVLNNILSNKNHNIKELFNILLSDTNKRFVFESITIILLISKCIKIDDTNILNGTLKLLQKSKNINNILKENIIHDNKNSYIIINDVIVIIPDNLSYNAEIMDDLSKIPNIDKHKFLLIIKDKTRLKDYENINSILDENDIILGLEIFRNNFKNYELKQFIETINKDYFSGRERLTLKLHEKLTLMKFIKVQNDKYHLVSHIRDKNITLLNMSKYLLENGKNKILILSDKIKSYTDDLDKYIDFTNIKYTYQDKYKNDFKGIVFCGIHDLDNKIEFLKSINFDVMIIDQHIDIQELTKDKPDTWKITNSGRYLTSSDRNDKLFETSNGCIH